MENIGCTNNISMLNKKPKILFIDIETLAELGWVWELYDTNVIEIERPGHLLSVAWKWQGKKTQVKGLDDFKGYKSKSGDDKQLCELVWKLLNEADIIIGHNAKAFDIKKLNYRFMVNGMKPPSPAKIIDTLVSMKSVAKAPSNKLNSLGKVMNIGKKLEHEGWDLWKKCYLGDKKAWKKMKKYNKIDVDLLEKWYLILRPWITNHPDLAVITDNRGACPHCLEFSLIKDRKSRVRNGWKQVYQCTSCGAYYTDPKINKDEEN